ncbi:hypothetical protein O7614_26495 [Micromonospora sp. WMMD961]|uniref:hypothetical protein n=1 Tax=Micromonospora sp. WMMD961 TaxID=3016100 RepID=UPI002417B949|nr:hypothetical protein [Micromonospora sp. WMMD961]MDG4783214.1 hypothetical protein [Micromonospora sp. WMMD961]
MDDDDADLAQPRHRPHRSKRFRLSGRQCACPSCRTARKPKRATGTSERPIARFDAPLSSGFIPQYNPTWTIWNAPTQINWTLAAELVTRRQQEEL